MLSCKNTSETTGIGNFKVSGYVKEFGNSKILFWAANPPTYGSSYTGSGLPFPNPNIAYENTENKGIVTCQNGNYTFNLQFPNAYYKGLGTVYVEPCYHVKLCGSEKIYTFKLSSGIPFRMITYPASYSSKPRTSATFYDVKDNGIRTQEQILRDSGFPSLNKIPKSFWGKKPPN